MAWGGRVLLAAGIATILAAQSQTTFYAAFADGQDAVRQGQWRAAIGALERAVRLRPAPAARVIIYGNNLLANYYPYTLLARCHLELGEPDRAADYLRQAEAQGEPAAVRDPIARRLVRLVDPAPPVQTPDASHGDPSGAKRPEPAPPVSTPPAPAPAPAPAVPGPPAAGPETKHGAAPTRPVPGPDVAALGSALVKPEPSRAPAIPWVPAPPLAHSPLIPAAPATPPVQRPEPIRPLPPVFWIVAAGGLAALGGLAASKGLRRRRHAPEAGGVPRRLGEAPETIGPYRIIRPLGQGAFATTYLAIRPPSGVEVALKVLHAHRLNDPDFRARFSQEARIGARLDHPNLARLLDPGSEENPGWIALEYVPGPTLEAHLKDRGRLPVAEAVGIALGMAEAMAYAHTLGVVHRDLKPANVILGPRGPKVMDLGIARELDAAGLTTTFAFMGTPLYAAPETQFMAKAGPAADRYSLGVILFEMLAGRHPFQGETPFAVMDQHRSAPVPDLRELCAVPPDLARLVERLLEKQPEDRPEDGELVLKLKAFSGDGG